MLRIPVLSVKPYSHTMNRHGQELWSTLLAPRGSHAWADALALDRVNLNPKPLTLTLRVHSIHHTTHPTTYTINTTPYTPHPTPYTIHTTLYTRNLKP